ncbi:FAD:protein FMN transferase [Coriobacteriia bacterium Es71-Z0120]|uniref:FAD:protein FMN transferase n=1 Tax=Parvivirga hydrogeniphila TaxID=2939460 RepID=UPI002260CC35|nr:FAD:protein FMN transferase [Parvivirga hydrogeniphila]MCL4079497.1 FAD:protein FMN transferase [Parvivirga hydrogeniphila]
MRSRNARRALAVLVTALVAASGAACAPAPSSVRETRPALGTIVTVEAYGADERATRDAIDAAFGAIAEVEHALDAYSATSTIASFNARPYAVQELPDEAVEVLDEVERLGVGDAFSPTLLSVVRLYGFDSTPAVPSPDDLALAVAAAQRFSRPTSATATFGRLPVADPRLDPDGPLAPGFDFGGAAKGLALDRARDALRARGVRAAIVTAGSTTVTLGTKPDGTPWRIGVEHPRATGEVMAVAEWAGDGALSTSGDYQQFFERDGMRYHHVLDPRTGQPAHGLQSLTVAGRLSGLASDILSTALFVRGARGALAYARERSVSVWLIDASGRVATHDGAASSGVTIRSADTP